MAATTRGLRKLNGHTAATLVLAMTNQNLESYGSRTVFALVQKAVISDVENKTKAASMFF